MKEGVLTPVFKKGKYQKIPSNYRGITVTTILVPTATYNSVHQYNHPNWDPPTTHKGMNTYSGSKKGKDQKIPSNYRESL